MNKKLKVLITGSSRGIGNSISNIYKENDYEVFNANSSNLDLSNLDLIEENYLKITEGQSIDCLICCAGINENKSLKDFNYKSGKKIIDINLLSNIELIKLASRSMKENKYGRIVLIGSLWSEFVREEKLFYAISKSGIVSLGKSAALELGKNNILVNTVSPGFVKTAMTDRNLSKAQINDFEKKIPLKRFATPEEIAKIVYFLGSSDNTYLTGQNILVDGGWSVG